MRAMEFFIRVTELLAFKPFIKVNEQESSKPHMTVPFERGIHWCQLDSPYNDIKMRTVCACYDAIETLKLHWPRPCQQMIISKDVVDSNASICCFGSLWLHMRSYLQLIGAGRYTDYPLLPDVITPRGGMGLYHILRRNCWHGAFVNIHRKKRPARYFSSMWYHYVGIEYFAEIRSYDICRHGWEHFNAKSMLHRMFKSQSVLIPSELGRTTEPKAIIQWCIRDWICFGDQSVSFFSKEPYWWQYRSHLCNTSCNIVLVNQSVF